MPSSLRAPAPRAPGLRRAGGLSPAATGCRRKFLRYFPGGFADPSYLDWERGYKWSAHERWTSVLGGDALREHVRARRYGDVARLAIAIEGRTNLLFSFEKMALREAVGTAEGARDFALGLERLLGPGPRGDGFAAWCDALARLPARRSRVFTWPVVTVFGFLARPRDHFFLKPTVTRRAATNYGVELEYSPRPSWQTYAGLLAFGARVARDLSDLEPRDMIDVQSFLWVQGSDEYP